MSEGSMEVKQQKAMKRILLLINTMMLAIGAAGGPLIMRLYFIHGGKRVWLSSCLLTAGFPITLFPITISYIQRRRSNNLTSSNTSKPKIFSTTPLLFVAFSVIGVICGLSNYLYAYGVARLPVSTSALIMATQLAFTAIFAFLLVRQKFTFYSVNAIILLTFGAGILAEHASSDRPAGESTKQYVIGFVLTLVAAGLTGLAFPMVEMMYQKTLTVTYSLVMELQMVMSFSSTVFCIIGMIIDNDFKVIPSEARQFGLGEAKYYGVLVGSALLWELNLMGVIGVIFCASSLFSAVVVSTMLPVTEVLAVIFYKEKFQAEKGISLVLSLWGFVSYFLGEYKQAKKIKKNRVSETELPLDYSIPTS